MIVIRHKQEYLDQKEFNIIGDIYRSGLNRTSKKYLGKARVKLAKRLSKSAIDDLRRGKASSYKFNELIDSKSPEILGKLREEATKNNLVVVDRVPEMGEKGNSAFVLPGHLVPTARRVLPSISSQIPEGEVNGIISLGKNGGLASLSHEIGHYRSSQSRNPIIRKISNISASSQEKNESLETALGRTGNNWQHGFKPILQDIGRGTVMLLDEANASRNGVRILKKLGINEADRKAVKNIQKAAFNTHMYPQKANIKTTIRNTIQIPSRRQRNIKLDLKD